MATADELFSLREDIRRLERLIADLTGIVQEVQKDQRVQFTRIAQLQADLDLIRAAWSKVKPSDAPDRRGKAL
jgi:hypothetical protein